MFDKEYYYLIMVAILMICSSNIYIYISFEKDTLFGRYHITIVHSLSYLGTNQKQKRVYFISSYNQVRLKIYRRDFLVLTK